MSKQNYPLKITTVKSHKFSSFFFGFFHVILENDLLKTPTTFSFVPEIPLDVKDRSDSSTQNRKHRLKRKEKARSSF